MKSESCFCISINIILILLTNLNTIRMKFHLRSIAMMLLVTSFTFAQHIQTHLTKVERTNNKSQIDNYFDRNLAPFYHGVASGDPLENAVIIWTRVTVNQPTIKVSWKIATDANMSQIANQGEVITNQSKDYTVKIDATGLNPFTTYYYQFEAEGKKSIIGKTRTTPAVDDMVDNVRLAVVSCSNYQNGYFNAYNQIANRDDIDAVVHLGDYIYEYESGGYGYSDDIGRGHLPENEIITLDDYRVRYSFYRLDPMLRNIHQKHPFIAIWDDHEFANDANKFGAENHTTATEGNWEVRKNNAYKAYFEWMPVRANTIEQYRLYRTISYGKLMDLIMLDTRIEGRDTQINSSKNLISAAASNEKFKNYVQDVIAKKDLSKRENIEQILETILPMVLTVSNTTKTKAQGLSQEEFTEVIKSFTDLVMNKESLKSKNNLQQSKLETLLQKGLVYNDMYNSKENKATYNSILGLEQFDWLTNQLSSSTAKWIVIGNQVMLMPWNGVPSNDAWDGYKTERDKLLNYIRVNSIDNVVVLTGDIHSTFAGEVRYNGDCEMCEFVVPSVTSQNLDVAGGIASGIGEFYIKLLNRHIKDVDLDNHGYFVLDVKEDRVQADWYDIEELSKPQVGETRSRGWYVNANNCRMIKARSEAKGINRSSGILSADTKEINNTSSKEDIIVIGVYPNPMQDEGNIHYLINNATKVMIRLYDMTGKMITTLQNKKVEKGVYNLSFKGDSIPKGNYIITIETNTTKISRKIIIQ
ncbi:T9SS type A sorting domain-containing protein [Aquimarina algicola]|uniref:T9SS type A sorting domain-containing protein n=2 Tax=Aquimarina algicola TaxID=2589995 RepID=A0A504JF34_9FLAO|nr:T9SS type A sorting domain-containing protein [Aquimarina algicola]